MRDPGARGVRQRHGGHDGVVVTVTAERKEGTKWNKTCVTHESWLLTVAVVDLLYDLKQSIVLIIVSHSLNGCKVT